MPTKKSPAQLDREIAESLAGGSHGGSLYEDLRSAGIPIDHHESDLYVLDSAAARALIARHGKRGTGFTSQVDGKRWLDVPFAYAPFWEKKQRHTAGHARKKKLDHHEARQRLAAAGIDFGRSSDELSMSEKQLVADTAREAGYRKRKDAPGSTARMYFQYLRRLGSGHATRKHTVYDLVEVNTKTKKERVLHQHFSTRADASEAKDEYEQHRRSGVTYLVRPRHITPPAYRWNRED